MNESEQNKLRLLDYGIIVLVSVFLSWIVISVVPLFLPSEWSEVTVCVEEKTVCVFEEVCDIVEADNEFCYISDQCTPKKLCVTRASFEVLDLNEFFERQNIEWSEIE